MAKDLFRTKISTEALLFQIRYFCTASTISEELHFGKKRIFQKRNIPHYSLFWRATFLERLIFQKTLSSMAVKFSEELFFYNILFQKSYHFTATLSFHSYTSYLSVGIEVSSVPITYSQSVGVLSGISITAESRIIDKVYLISWLHKALWNCYFSTRLLFE